MTVSAMVCLEIFLVLVLPGLASVVALSGSDVRSGRTVFSNSAGQIETRGPNEATAPNHASRCCEATLPMIHSVVLCHEQHGRVPPVNNMVFLDGGGAPQLQAVRYAPVHGPYAGNPPPAMGSLVYMELSTTPPTGYLIATAGSGPGPPPNPVSPGCCVSAPGPGAFWPFGFACGGPDHQRPRPDHQVASSTETSRMNNFFPGAGSRVSFYSPVLPAMMAASAVFPPSTTSVGGVESTSGPGSSPVHNEGASMGGAAVSASSAEMGAALAGAAASVNEPKHVMEASSKPVGSSSSSAPSRKINLLAAFVAPASMVVSPPETRPSTQERQETPQCGDEGGHVVSQGALHDRKSGPVGENEKRKPNFAYDRRAVRDPTRRTYLHLFHAVLRSIPFGSHARILETLADPWLDFGFACGRGGSSCHCRDSRRGLARTRILEILHQVYTAVQRAASDHVPHSEQPHQDFHSRSRSCPTPRLTMRIPVHPPDDFGAGARYVGDDGRTIGRGPGVRKIVNDPVARAKTMAEIWCRGPLVNRLRYALSKIGGTSVDALGLARVVTSQWRKLLDAGGASSAAKEDLSGGGAPDVDSHDNGPLLELGSFGGKAAPFSKRSTTRAVRYQRVEMDGMRMHQPQWHCVYQVGKGILMHQSQRHCKYQPGTL